MIKIAAFYNGGFSSFLTKIFTGCGAHHIAFIFVYDSIEVINAQFVIYEMDVRRRARIIDKETLRKKISKGDIVLYDCPVEVSRQYLENETLYDSDRYGVIDYLLFVLNPIKKFLGLRIKNHQGMICSEMVNDDLIYNKWESPWHLNGEPPSPCDLASVLKKSEFTV